MKKFTLFILFSFALDINIYAEKVDTKLDIVTSNSAIDAIVSDSAIDAIVSGSAIEIINPTVKKVQILDIINTYDNSIKFYPLNSSIDDIVLYKKIFVQIGPKQFLNCYINWDSIDTIDTSVIGRTSLKGEIIPLQGYSFDGGLEPFVEIPFFIYEKDMEPLITVYKYDDFYDDLFDNNMLMPLGGCIYDYININNKYLFYTEYGDYFYCPVDWEIPIDAFNTVGTTTIKGKYKLPPGFKAKNEQSMYRYETVYIMKDDDIYLDYIYSNLRGFVTVQWIKSIEDFNNIKVFCRENNGQYYRPDESIYNVYDDQLIVYSKNLNRNINYEFKLNYNGKDYGNIHIYIDKNVKFYHINIDGDKDGGDNKKQELPVYTHSTRKNNNSENKKNKKLDKFTLDSVFQDIKEFETEITTESETKIATEFETEVTTELCDIKTTANEEITPNKTIISGDKLIETKKTQGDYITFEKSGVAVEIPSDFIEDYNINKNDYIGVEIDRDEENINIAVDINDKPVKNIEGAKLRISDKTEEINKDNTTIKNISNDDRFSEFSINNLGTYTTDSKEKKDTNNYGSILISTLVFIGAGFIKWLITKK